jgi:hypothetical protein
MQTSFIREVFLGDSHCFAIPPQVLAKHVSEVSFPNHEFTLDKMMSLRLQTLSSTS